MKTPAREAHEAHMAMRDRALINKDSLMTDKMRYRKALLLACGGDEAKAREFLAAADGVEASVRASLVPQKPEEWERQE